MPCDNCGEFQLPQLRHFEWKDRDVGNAIYICEHCEHSHDINEQGQLKAAGKWIATREGERRKVGFRINQFGSSLADWRETLAEFLEVNHDPEKLQVYVNTVLAEGWTEPGEEIDSNNLLLRAEDYGAECPDGVLIITAGVDVQEDRLEVYVIGWGVAEESWYLDAAQLYGPTDQAAVWADLSEYLNNDFKKASGALMRINTVFIDSGFRADFVYDFCNKHRGRGIHPIKGVAGENTPMIGTPSQKRGKQRVRQTPIYPLGVDSLKALIYSRLRLTEIGPGYVHIPSGRSLFSNEFVLQLTAEKRVTKFRRGYPFKEWRQMRARNEALDCTVYALGALRMMSPNWRRLALRGGASAQAPIPNASKRRQTQGGQQRGSGWLNTGKWL